MGKHSKKYDDYMKSDAWAAKREERLQLAMGEKTKLHKQILTS